MIVLLEIAFLSVTIIAYAISKKIYNRFKQNLLSPILISPLIIVVFLILFHIPYSHYKQGADVLSKLLEPTIVAFAYPLYKYRDILKRHGIQIVCNVCIGSVISIIMTLTLSKLFHMGISISDSIAPHIVTTPIAMDITGITGGSIELTALFVIMTALIAVLTAPFLIRIFHIKTAVAKGIIFGTSANGTGTAKAFEIGQLEGTIATISMLLTGVCNLLLVPLSLLVFM